MAYQIRRLVLPALLVLCGLPLSGQQKYALVIGNSAYTATAPLRNPVNDALDMKGALESLGWSVALVTDGNLGQMEAAVMQLKKRLTGSRRAYGFFFYAGHAVQSGGENYLIPVDAVIDSENLLRQRAMSVQFMLNELNDAENELNIAVLDACRDNPFSWKRSGSRGGLQVVTHQPAGSIVIFATSADATAADRAGRNGLFTAHFLANLRKPGLSVTELFNQTGNDVARASGYTQFPEMHSKYYGAAYLGTKPGEPPAPPSTPAGFALIPGGTFMMGSPVAEAGRRDNEAQHQVTVSSFLMGQHEVTRGEFRRFVNATGYKTTAETAGGGYVYTGAEWEKKSDANWNHPYLNQTDDHPVTQVSWYDAVEYCNWLSRQENRTPAYTVNGQTVTRNRNADGYRLPTEAEWEYACRAGTTAPAGTTADAAGWYDRNSSNTTHPVGQKQANSWGLYDMYGNVLEWCWDWYGVYPDTQQTDPPGASAGARRVNRGGGWLHVASVLRPACRGGDAPTFRSFDLGFRLLRPAP